MKKVSVKFCDDKPDMDHIYANNVERLQGDVYEISLGFVAFEHLYEAWFNVAHNLGENIIDVSQSKLIKVTSLELVKEGDVNHANKNIHRVQIKLRVEKEMTIEETLVLQSVLDETRSVKVIIRCKVLTIEMGYPNLNRNVRFLDNFNKKKK